MKLTDMVLDASVLDWLFIPGGDANSIMPLQNNSTLLVGADLSMDAAVSDNKKWSVESIKTKRNTT